MSTGRTASRAFSPILAEQPAVEKQYTISAHNSWSSARAASAANSARRCLISLRRVRCVCLILLIVIGSVERFTVQLILDRRSGGVNSLCRAARRIRLIQGSYSYVCAVRHNIAIRCCIGNDWGRFGEFDLFEMHFCGDLLSKRGDDANIEPLGLLQQAPCRLSVYLILFAKAGGEFAAVDGVEPSQHVIAAEAVGALGKEDDRAAVFTRLRCRFERFVCLNHVEVVGPAAAAYD